MYRDLPYFAKCYLNTTFRLIYTKLNGEKMNPKKIVGKKVLSVEDANNYIYNTLRCGTPFMVARYGSVELGIMVKYVTRQFGLIHAIPDRHMQVFCNNAGFFPYDREEAGKFAELMLELSSQVDLLGVWNDIMEDYIIKKYASQTQLTNLSTLCPFDYEKPWTAALEGKKVLVIHPFEDSIRQQYKKREMLFKNPKMLPSFELKTIKAVQTIAGNKCEFDSWFMALDYMTNKALQTDFDIAIIGCGAYGFPLAARLKKSGKQAIHLGGATQYLFGIKSKRGESHPVISTLYNENWIRPSENEKPKGFEKIEDGCYW